MLVRACIRRQGHGREIVSELVRKATREKKAKLQLSCKPKHSGEKAPEYFFESVKFERTKSQDAGALDDKIPYKKNPHDRRCKMVMHLAPGG